MTPFIISQVLLWAVVFVLGLTVLALTRQVGVLHERIAPAGALAANSNLKVGDAAPELELNDLTGNDVKIGGENHKSTLLFFISPDCPICKTLLPALKSSLRVEQSWLSGIFVSDGGNEGTHIDYVKQYSLDDWPYILSSDVGVRFAVSKLPYAVLVDESGIIRSLGMVNSREHLESLFNAKDLGVESIQEYLSKKTA